MNWGRLGIALRWIGRHSLILYLVHQPLLLAVLVPLESVMQPHTWHRAERFVSECRPSCEYGGTDPAYCVRYCSCALEQIETNDMWEAVRTPSPTDAQRRDLSEMIALCTAMGQSATD